MNSTATRTNKYAGTCACGAKVAAGAGTLGPKVAGRWTTRCATCSAARPAARPASTYRTYRTVDGGTVRYSEDTDDAFDARRDGFIY